MLFLANLIMRDPKWSLMMCAGLGVATLIFAPVGFLAGSAIALVTLSAGLTYGIRALAVTAAAGLLISSVQGSLTPLWIALVEFWGAGFVLAVVLGRSGSLSKAISSAVLVIVGVMLVAHAVMLPTPELVWASYIQQIASELQATGTYLDPEAEVMLTEQLPAVLTMLMLMGLLVVWVGIVFLARWWQKNLYPQADGSSFGSEFRALRLPNAMALAFLVGVVALLFLPEQSMLSEVVAVLSVAFMLQGLAVVHHWVFVRNNGTWWLVLVYLMLAILPHFMMMVAVLGWMENWLNWRSKMSVSG